MAAYWIAHVTVNDADSYGQYVPLAKAAVEDHGGVFLARGTRTVWLEGQDRARNVLVRFDSVEAAERCYHSDAYQAALRFVEGAAERELCIVEGE